MKTLNLLLSLGITASLAAATSGGTFSANNAAAPSSPAYVVPAQDDDDDDEVLSHEEGGIQFTMPAGWKAEKSGEAVTVNAPDKSISVTFWVPEGDTFEAAVDAVGDELEKRIKNPKLNGEGRKGTHNEMPYYSLSGSGEVNDQDVLFSMDMVMAKKPVIILSFASPENFKRNAAEYNKLLQSIKRIG